MHLAGRVIRLDEGPLDVQRGEHAYHPPYDRHRNGGLFEQRHESYIEAVATGTRARVLSVFAAFGPDTAPEPWTDEGASHVVHIQSPLGIVNVRVDEHGLILDGPRSQIVANG